MTTYKCDYGRSRCKETFEAPDDEEKAIVALVFAGWWVSGEIDQGERHLFVYCNDCIGLAMEGG